MKPRSLFHRTLTSFGGLALGLASIGAGSFAQASTVQFPTANRALLEAGGEERFFVGTAGKPWTSGQFGCVRSGGGQLHEGLDIKCLQRDKRGEPIDPVSATANGVVAYVNTKPGLSNYGNYVVIRHQLDGVEVFSLYAHLSAVRPGLKPGDPVRGGERIATMGRTSNTHQKITKDRAHCHFEFDLMLNERFAQWHDAKKNGERNDHGNFNGHNLAGFDPAAVLKEAAAHGGAVDFAAHLQSRPEMFRVAIRAKSLSILRRSPRLLQRNPLAERDGVAGYEVAVSFNGVPLRIIPRSAAELKSPAKVTLLGVNEAEWRSHPCGKLVFKRGQAWTLLARGQDWVELLTY